MKKLITCLFLLALTQLYSAHIYEGDNLDDNMISYSYSTLASHQSTQNNTATHNQSKREPNYCALGSIFLGALAQLHAAKNTIQDPRYKLPLELVGGCLTTRGSQVPCLDPEKCCVCIPPTTTGKAACCFGSVCVPLTTHYGLPFMVSHTCPSVTETITMPMLECIINEGTAVVTGCITQDRCWPCKLKK